MRLHSFFWRATICFLLLSALLLLTACRDATTDQDADNAPSVSCSHEQSEWVVDREPTAEAVGLKHRQCLDCGATLESETTPRLDPVRDRITAELTPSIVKVIGYGEDGTTQVSQGSGMFIDARGTFITNAHVVKNCHFVQIQDHTGQIYNADTLLAYATGTSDYAILSIAEELTTVPVSFTEDAALGSTVYALGFPDDAETLCVTTGELLSAINYKQYKSSARTAHGNSGGALVDQNGLVIGITSSLMQDGNCLVLRPIDYKEAIAEVLAGTKTPVRSLPIRSAV